MPPQHDDSFPAPPMPLSPSAGEGPSDLQQLQADDAYTTEPTVIPEHEEATMTDPQHYAPPAHLAARFYRNRANARRKSSTASSRRNSLSSVHSHTSSLSHRRSATVGCQSNHIAQHLRRNSIIESRKARLADRAAHAEQVRLRAALAKSTPRGSQSNTEEKALAAQVAKEKYLAKVAAACAEEVARAKRIAEETRERKLADEVRVRMEMEERHAEAEKRRTAGHQRALHKSRGARRTDSVEAEKKLAILEEIPDVDEEAVVDDVSEVLPEPLSEDAAGARIQRAWRMHHRRKIVQAFTAMDLYGRTNSLGFEEMTALVADVETIAVTTALLTHLGLQEANDENASLNTRTFLSAYMIIGHSAAVLNNKNGAQEQDLIAKATELVNSFETSLFRLAEWNNFCPNATQLETLSQTYSGYTSAFAAWRLQDSSVLIEGMVASFVELDAIWQTVKDDSRGQVATDYREGIRDNQVMLLSRIRKLAGPDRADVLIKKAIRESRRKRPKRRPAAEVRPRGVEAMQGESSAQQPPVESSDENVVEGAALPEATENSFEGDKAGLTKLFTPMPSNRVLTHELAIDKEYRLEDTHGEMRFELYRSICESMKRGFETGEAAVWTVSAAENVREKLLRMLKPGNSMHTLISDTMDLDSIYRQSQQGVFSYAGFFQFMASVLPKLCAPFRDADMKALTEELQSSDNDDVSAMVEKLFKLLRMVDSLSLDYSNFMIMNAAPTLIREAPGYEQRAFAKDLESGVFTLDNTTRWWRASYAQLSAEADRRDPEGIRNSEDRPTAERVYAHALVHLAMDQGEMTPSTFPETLHLDFERARRLRAQSLRITVIGAILLTAKNLLKRDSRSQWKTEASRLWTLLSNEPYAVPPPTDSSIPTEPTPAQKAFSILETAHNMPPATKSQLLATISRFFTQAASSTSTAHASTSALRLSDPVLKVLYQRLRAHVLARLSAATAGERVRVTSGASEALAGMGMPELTEQVATVVEGLERVREVDWKGHGEWYWGVWGGMHWGGEGMREM